MIVLTPEFLTALGGVLTAAALVWAIRRKP